MLIGAGLVLVTKAPWKWSELDYCRSWNDRRSQVFQKRGVTQNEGCTKHHQTSGSFIESYLLLVKKHDSKVSKIPYNHTQNTILRTESAIHQKLPLQHSLGPPGVPFRPSWMTWCKARFWVLANTAATGPHDTLTDGCDRVGWISKLWKKVSRRVSHHMIMYTA